MHNLLAELPGLQQQAAVGRMASSLAHELRNLLVPILGYGELALSDLPAEHPARQDLRQMIKGAKRIRDLLASNMRSGSAEHRHSSLIDLPGVVRDGLNLLRCSCPGRTTLVLTTHPGVPPLVGDEGELHQVILNLGQNAIEALSTEDGKVAFEIDCIDLDASDDATIKPGRFVRLRVSDEGVGMSEEVRARLFEPYFTTRGNAGLGLGLSRSMEIAKAHGGTIRATSKPGSGSCFEVLLPASWAEPKPTKQDARPTVRVLCMDADQLILATANRILVRLGACVTSALDSEAGLRILARTPQDFDIALTSLDGADQSGLHWLEALQAIAPDMPGLVVVPDRKAAERPADWPDNWHIATLDTLAGDEHLLQRLVTQGA